MSYKTWLKIIIFKIRNQKRNFEKLLGQQVLKVLKYSTTYHIYWFQSSLSLSIRGSFGVYCQCYLYFLFMF